MSLLTMQLCVIDELLFWISLVITCHNDVNNILFISDGKFNDVIKWLIILAVQKQ